MHASVRRWLWRPFWTGVKTLVIGYLGVVFVLALLENSLVFHPVTAARDWVPPPIDEFEEIRLASADGTPIHAWWLPRPGSERTVLYLHGNAGNLSHRGNSVVKLRKLLDASVLILDYPGYGKSGGAPTEAGCYLAGDAGYQWLTQAQGRDPKQLILYGASLGGGVALNLATRHPHHALVLLKTFTSAPDVGARWFPWVPVRWIMRNRFDNLDRIKGLRTPVFIAHGTADDIIPFEHGERLYAAAGEPKAFLKLDGQNHNDALSENFFQELRAFLDRHSPQ